ACSHSFTQVLDIPTLFQIMISSGSEPTSITITKRLILSFTKLNRYGVHSPGLGRMIGHHSRKRSPKCTPHHLILESVPEFRYQCARQTAQCRCSRWLATNLAFRSTSI